MEHRSVRTDSIQQIYWEENLPHSSTFHREFLHLLRLVTNRASAVRTRKLTAGEGYFLFVEKCPAADAPGAPQP
jgi:hypothetical protein